MDSEQDWTLVSVCEHVPFDGRGSSSVATFSCGSRQARFIVCGMVGSDSYGDYTFADHALPSGDSARRWPQPHVLRIDRRDIPGMVQALHAGLRNGSVKPW